MRGFANPARMGAALLAIGACLAPGVAKAANSQAQAPFDAPAIMAPAQSGKHSAVDALKWIQREAEQGNAKASFELGWMHQNGDGVTRDVAKALEWYQAAALQGNIYAYFSLDLLYEEAIDVGWDVEGYIRSYERAASQGNIYAYYPLGFLHERRGNYEEAFKWYKKSADQGVLFAYYPLGALYQRGSGVAQNVEEARTWYRKTIMEVLLLLAEAETIAPGLPWGWRDIPALPSRASAPICGNGSMADSAGLGHQSYKGACAPAP